MADLGVCWDNVICAKNKIDLGNFSLILGSGNKLKSSDNGHRPIGNRVQIVCSGFDVAQIVNKDVGINEMGHA